MPPKQTSPKNAPGRLPNIAPREHESLSTDSKPMKSPYADVPRTRLPPRSRSGCWTCRTRKVKCDEQRPRCQQCARLGHPCDYSPKLAFKDETPKIVDKYVGTGTTSPAWDTTVDPFAKAAALYNHLHDSLPPFTSLSTEEDWQRKAEHRPPGTYYVVANSSSFSDVEEYRQREDDTGPISGPFPGTRPETKHSPRNPNVSLDSRTIILGTFEDNPRRVPLLPSNSAVDLDGEENSQQLTSPTSATLSQGFDQLRVSPEPHDTYENILGLNDHLESRLQYQYRTVVRWHLMQNHSLLPNISSQIEDAFEQEAKRYPPLKHALNALSSLSLSHQDHSYGVIALQRYQAALEALKHEQDVASNGSFLTTFVLLLYEIAGTEPFWPYHMNTLKQIIHLRRQHLKSEPFPYVVWWTCLVDLNALLSGSGYGPLFLSLIHNNVVPTATEMKEATSFLGSAAIFDGDRDLLIAAWVLQREIGIAAARMGEAALQMRTAYLHNAETTTSLQNLQEFQQQVAGLMEMLQQAWQRGWTPALANAVKDRRLAEEAYAIFTAARLIYYSCVIFVSTCMWPSQARDMGHESSGILTDAARKIVSISQESIQTHRLERRFAVFPLLLAGTVLPPDEERQRIPEMLSIFAQTTLGTNTRATIDLSNNINELHREAGMYAPGLDFLSVVKGRESQLVNYGL